MNPIVHDCPGKLFCGPAALAAITGLKTSAFESLNAAGKCSTEVMRETLKLHGYSMGRGWKFNAVPIREIKSLSLCIVDPAPGHWIVVEDGYLLDSANRTPTPINNTRFADSEASWCYTITKS